MSLALRRSAIKFKRDIRISADICLAQIATLRGIPGKPWRPIARTNNNYYYYTAHAQRMRRSVTDIYIYIPIARA